MKSQEAAFRSARKPAPKPKVAVEVKAATPKGIKKNKSRNDRRKAARKTAALMKAGGAVPAEKKQESAEVGAKENDDEMEELSDES